MMASRVSALSREIISYALATPLMPFADATTTGRDPSRFGAPDSRDSISAVCARDARPKVSPAAPATPVPMNLRRETDMVSPRAGGRLHSGHGWVVVYAS